MADPRPWYRNRILLVLVGLALVSMILVLGPILGVAVDTLGFIGSGLAGLVRDPFGRLVVFNVLVLLGVLVYRRRDPEGFASWFGSGRRNSPTDIARDYLRGDEASARKRLRSLGRVEEGTSLHRFVRAVGRLIETGRGSSTDSGEATRRSMLAPFDASLTDEQIGSRLAQRGHPLALVPAAEWAKTNELHDLAVAITHAALARLGDDPEAVLRLAEVLKRDDPPRQIQRAHLVEAVQQDLTRHWRLFS